MPFNGLKPETLWKHFEDITKIPHCSGNETELGKYILAWAQKKQFKAQKDANGNVVVRIPASPGRENAPTVVLQGHLDMVGEKNSDVKHDFDKDPIEVERSGEWLTAKGTTLGADNGIGLSASLAVADMTDTSHGPLELLFTVDEEVGLTGAGKLEAGFITGNYMLNLDSEELGAVYIGCSGGGDSTIKLPVKVAGSCGAKAVSVAVCGLRGGHSGIDIQEQRGNAIKILARALSKAARDVDYGLSSINGGNKRNAIPREARAEITINEAEFDSFCKKIAVETEDIKVEMGSADPGLEIRVESTSEAPSSCMDKRSRDAILNMLLAVPHGVEAMSLAVPGLVETSNNLATIETSGSDIIVGTSSRSPISSALQAVRDSIRAVGELAGAAVEEDDPYPGWNPDPDSHLLAVVKSAHEELFKKLPDVKAIHAGLECGIIGERFPRMQMVSFGPHIEHPHSPEERVHIDSVQEFWDLLCAVLGKLAEE